MRHPLLWLLLLCATVANNNICRGEEPRRRFSLLEMNVENLFDTIHDEGMSDYEYLPQAPRRWDSRRYWTKLGRLARLIAACGGASPVDLVALCEVENDSVLHDLTTRTYLKRLGYEFVMTKSKDVRGIDVALLYQPLTFSPFKVQSLQVPRSQHEVFTRDILLVSGRIPTGDTLDVFVCHFPSRSGGRRATEIRRRQAARRLRAAFDSICNVRRFPAVIIAGDFNDTERDKSLRYDLQVRILDGKLVEDGASEVGNTLFDVSVEAFNASTAGTYKFRHRWYALDHILVSGALLHPKATLCTRPGDSRVVSLPFLLENDGLYGMKPRRTYLGTAYHGGISDHLPLQTDFWY